jgi:hypothetical protein
MEPGQFQEELDQKQLGLRENIQGKRREWATSNWVGWKELRAEMRIWAAE